MLKDFHGIQNNNQNPNDEVEVALPSHDEGFYQDLDYPMVAQANYMVDLEMGTEEQKKEKTKTPSTGKFYLTSI